MTGVSSLRGLLDWEWMVQIYKSCLLSGAYLLWSSCIASYILPHFTIQYGRWAEGMYIIYITIYCVPYCFYDWMCIPYCSCDWL